MGHERVELPVGVEQAAHKFAEPLRGDGESVLDLVQSAPVFMSWSTVGKIAGEGGGDGDDS